MSEGVTFIAGATAALSGVAALYFGRFWRVSRDRFFGFFACAFALFAVNRIVLMTVDQEHAAWVFVFRLAAFLLILIAIVDKNRPRRT
ncbi:MAG TPA: DUF5985 family protein [Casimicrobiaceae bacterium]